MNPSNTFECRSIVEVLRTGVPSETLVRVLAPSAPVLGKHFSDVLRAVSSGSRATPTGLLFGGPFGAGKSHLLERLAFDAIAENFVVSRAKVSKNLPLSKGLEFLFQLVQETRARGYDDDAFAQIVMQATEQGQLGPMLKWTESEVATGALAPGFAATLRALIGIGGPSEHATHILDYWAGAAVPVATLRAAVRAGGQRTTDLILARAAQRPQQTVRFIARLYQQLGRRGWVVVLDEVELIRLLGPVSRAQSYAALARWLGLEPAWRVPGLGTVAAITDTFGWDEIDALNPAGRQDEAHLPLRLQATEANRELVEPCKVGLAAIRNNDLMLPKLTERPLRVLQGELQDVYQTAFGCEVRPLAVVRDPNKSLRAYIRSWITAWDLQRQGRADEIVIGGVAPNPDTDGLDDD